VCIEGEFCDGFLSGRAAAIADWQFRKEQRDPGFRALCARLMAHRYYWSDPDRARQKKRERWAELGEEVLAVERATTLARNAALVRVPCEVCGGDIPPWKRPDAKCCSRRCTQRRNSQRFRDRGRR
jgi:RNA polymerase-binding transcription factor DksA